MNDKVTISLFQLAQMFPTEESARAYLEQRRWPNGAVCPTCQSGDRITIRKGGYYRCNACKLDFTVRTSTIFERSHIPLNKWIFAMYLLVTARKGISSMQLSKELSITQKSAWFMLHRLREACGNDLEVLRGFVEVDETYIGGKAKSMSNEKRMAGTMKSFAAKKVTVVGMREVGGRTKAQPIKSSNASDICQVVADNVQTGSMLHTDESPAYEALEALYGRASVCHKRNEYHRNGVGTNGIESVWAVLKRGLHGVYHHASEKHLARYVDEFTFRLNDGNVKRHTMKRLESFAKAAIGRRITYKELIKK